MLAVDFDASPLESGSPKFTGRSLHRARLTTTIAKVLRIRSAATSRFSAWLRRSLASTWRSEGRWVSTMAVSTLFRCCPPGPDRRVRTTSHCLSSSGMGSSAGCMRVSFLCGESGKVWAAASGGVLGVSHRRYNRVPDTLCSAPQMEFRGLSFAWPTAGNVSVH